MAELPAIIERGQRARLFPVLADTSKEGRTLSIFLSCFETVDDFGRALLGSLGEYFGSRSKIESYTEVVLKKTPVGKDGVRPDGLVVVTTGSRVWTALVEAKVGNSDLTPSQVEAYLELAKLNGIDALITLSNQFAALPWHHPISANSSGKRKVSLFHWSWMFVVTKSALLLSDGEITDREQRVILREMNRFLLHQSSGVKGFDQMPAAWSDLCSRVMSGGSLSAGDQITKDVVAAWHQELGDLVLVLSRQLEIEIDLRMSRAHASDPQLRQRDDQKSLSEDAELAASLAVPDAAGAIQICADIKKRSVTVSMRLRAPDEPKSAKARVNWLLRQLQEADATDIYVRCFWPGRTPFSQSSLAKLRLNLDEVVKDHPGQPLLSFEVLLVKDLGGRFSGRKTFIEDLEKAASGFYQNVGENVKAWQARAPRLKDEKLAPTDVGPQALREEAEQDALAGET